MKKIILIAFGFTAWAAQSQIEIRKAGETEDVSGTTISYDISLADVPQDDEWAYWEGAKFHVYNMTGSDQQFRLKRVRVTVPSDWKDNLCWPPTCFTDVHNQETGGYYITPGSGTWAPPTILDGGTDLSTGGPAEIKPQLYPGQLGSSATYKYIVTDMTGNVHYDSVTIVVNYFDVLSISAAQKVATELTMSPNPASDYVTIQAEGITDGRIRVVDVLGNVVYTGEFNNSRKLNTSEFKNGVYFITVQNSSNKGITKKLVVRH